MPYSDLARSAFWATCRESPDFAVTDLFAPKFAIGPRDRIATIGSCFAQHIGRHLRQAGAQFMDMEPAPRGMPADRAGAFGYGLFSARYGNVYTPRQLRQLVADSWWRRVDRRAIWTREGRFFDAMRPAVEPEGLSSPRQVVLHRLDHLHRVGRLFRSSDVLVITLGMTEFWADRRSGRAYPSCPGVIAGQFDPRAHMFCNTSYREARRDLAAAIRMLRWRNRRLRILLTVSPVPLTATASGTHVVAANAYSKATLRAVAGDLAAADPLIDYFPSYEMIALWPGARGMFAGNLRQVSAAGVAHVMARFDEAYPALAAGERAVVAAPDGREAREVCEDLLLEAMRPR